ncbi:MAG: pyridoxal-phosphate dependent enzyme [Halioglobus sp.]|nr:pyridoxal-phosphate dependent enzyme [Halioglobus sp.]
MSDTPVLGVSFDHVSLLRLDQTGGLAPGNKAFKLRHYFFEAKRLGAARLISFGGPWSNHLHALAAMGCQLGVETVGIVRGELREENSAMLSDARRWGMHIVYVSREDYRQRNEAAYQQKFIERFAPSVLIPEGGASRAGARGCMAVADIIRRKAPLARHIVVPVGTGTTMAGLVAGLDESFEIDGISALKGAHDLTQRVKALLPRSARNSRAHWRILHDYHCGGFARVNVLLREFMLAFETIHGVELDPVYTGKMLLAIHQLRACGVWHEGASVLAIHTGGLQGRRGYSWLG